MEGAYDRGDFIPRPLDDEEREAIEQDLLDVEVLKELLGPRGIKGTVFYCPDCEEDHYLDWDLLASNLKQALRGEEQPVHEPAYDPDPDDYVTWDYARGFLDGFEALEEEERSEIAARVSAQLSRSGWSHERIRELLLKAELFSQDREGRGGF